MTTTEFIGALVRAANSIDRVDPIEVGQLLYEAIVMITKLRKAAGIPETGTSQDAIIRLRDAAFGSAIRSRPERSVALLEAAEMIRTLYILVDSGVSISLWERDLVVDC